MNFNVATFHTNLLLPVTEATGLSRKQIGVITRGISGISYM
jgi:hypothetical protein